MGVENKIVLSCRQEMRDLIKAGYFLSGAMAEDPQSQEAYMDYCAGMELCDAWSRRPELAMALYGHHLSRHGGVFDLNAAEKELAFEDSLFGQQELLDALQEKQPGGLLANNEAAEEVTRSWGSLRFGNN